MSQFFRKISRTVAGFLLPLFLAVPVFAASPDYTYSTSGRTWTKLSGNTWAMDIDGDGATDVTLTASKDDSGNDVWTYEFAVEDDARNYYAYEKMLGLPDKQVYPDGYSSKGSDGKLDIAADPGQVDGTTHSYTITNTKENKVLPTNFGEGSLKITKNVDGIMRDPEQRFVFHIALTAPSSSGIAFTAPAEVFGDTAFTVTSDTSASADIALGNGETKTIDGIPAGVTYVITETPQGASAADYTVESKTGDTGTIAKNAVSESVWTNKSSYVKEAETVSFTVTKKVSGPAAADDGIYSFHVHFEGLGAGSTYAYQIGTADAVNFTADSTGASDVSLSLKKDETMTVRDIPVGAHYQVMEEGGDYEASYTVEDPNGAGTVVTMNGKADKGVQLSTGNEVAEKGESVHITFTNNYPATQNLTVRKKMADIYNGADKTFTFTVEFTGLKDSDAIDSDAGRIAPDEYGEAMRTFTLTAGKDKTAEMVFRNVPAGARYKVTEAGNAFKPAYQITTVDTNGKAKTGTYVQKSAQGFAGKDFSTGKTVNGEETEETVEANESDTVTFTNNVVLNFGIIKQNGTAPVSGAGYTVYKYDGTALTKVGTASTGTDGFAGWGELTPGVYVLSESTVPAGYTAAEDVLFVLGNDGIVRYAVADDRNKDAAAVAKDTDRQNRMAEWKTCRQYTDGASGMIYTAFLVNDDKLPHLPASGGMGIYAYLIIGAAIMAGAVLFYARKKN